MIRCQEMATLQHKVSSASSSVSLRFIVSVKWCRMIDSVLISHIIYCSCRLKSLSKLRALIGLRASFGIFLLHQNSSLFTVTFEEKVLTLAKSRGS